MNFNEYIQDKSRLQLIGVGVILTLFACFLDYITSPAFSPIIFYLLPAAIAAWYIGRMEGLAFAGAGSVAWLVLNGFMGRKVSWVTTWGNTIELFIILGAGAVLLADYKRLYASESTMAKRDTLTDVYNIKYFYRIAADEINRSKRFRHMFTAAYFDIDDFKAINEKFGRSAGDTILSVFARTLTGNVRGADIIARAGGEEFVILFLETGYEQTNFILHRLQKKLVDAVAKNNWPLTFSVGAVTFTAAPDTVDEVLRKSYLLMHSAKQKGKNTIIHKNSDDVA